MTEHRLDLFEISSPLSAELGAGPAQVVRAEVLDADRQRRVTDDLPDGIVRKAHIENRAHSTVVGLIPTGWYPSALLLVDHDRTLYIGNAKGEEGHPDPNGPHFGKESDKTLQKSSLEVLPVTDLKEKLLQWTHQVTENTPYYDSLLSEARLPQEPSIEEDKRVPQNLQDLTALLQNIAGGATGGGTLKHKATTPTVTVYWTGKQLGRTHAGGADMCIASAVLQPGKATTQTAEKECSDCLSANSSYLDYAAREGLARVPISQSIGLWVPASQHIHS